MLLEPPSLGSTSTNNKLEGRRRKVGTLGIGGGECGFSTGARLWHCMLCGGLRRNADLRSCGSDRLGSHLSLSSHSPNLFNEPVSGQQAEERVVVYTP